MYLYAYALVTPFMFLQPLMIAWHLLYWDLFPKCSLRRLVPLAILLLGGISIPLFQIYIYREITSVKIIDDNFLFVLICFESLASMALLFYLLKRRESHYLFLIKRALFEELHLTNLNRAYLQHIYNLILARSSKREIVDALWEITTQQMGLKGDRPATERCAERFLLIPKQIGVRS